MCTIQVELVPSGGSKAVTAENVMEYIHRVANYRLNFQIKAASEAFWQGFYDLVAQGWVTMFSEEEVQMLISGGSEGLDVADMQAHVNYAGGYHEEHPVIIEFWKVCLDYRVASLFQSICHQAAIDAVNSCISQIMVIMHCDTPQLYSHLITCYFELCSTCQLMVQSIWLHKPCHVTLCTCRL